MSREQIVWYCKLIEESLRQCEPETYGWNWVQSKMEFFILYQSPFVFSTRFGADFFSLVRYHVETNTPLKPLDPKHPLGEQDKNFNKWLTTLLP